MTACLELNLFYFYFYFVFFYNGQKRELPVLFSQKRMYPKNHSGRECCWPYLIGQHPLSPVFGQKRPGTPGNSYFAQLPPVFGHFMFLSGGLLDCSNRSTWEQEQLTAKFRPGDVEIDNIFSFFCVCVCVCFLPIHFGHQVRWTYQPGSHRRKVTQDFSSTFFLGCMP